MQMSLSSVLPKRVYPVSMRMHSKATQRKLASHKKTSRGKVSRRRLVSVAKLMLTLVETQQLPDFEKIDSTGEISGLK